MWAVRSLLIPFEKANIDEGSKAVPASTADVLINSLFFIITEFGSIIF
jgi:hypothetical protein